MTKRTENQERFGKQRIKRQPPKIKRNAQTAYELDSGMSVRDMAEHQARLRREFYERQDAA